MQGNARRQNDVGSRGLICTLYTHAFLGCSISSNVRLCVASRIRCTVRKKECSKRSHYTGMHPELNKCKQARLIPGEHIHPIKDVSQFRTECPINRSNGRRKRRLIRGSTFTRSRTYPSAGLGVQLIVLLILLKGIASISDDFK